MRKNWFLWLCVVVIGSVITYRATVIPFTHDEASTWLNYRHINAWSCISNAACWGTANNHWLNTILLQWSASLFGEGSLALRLPNVFAGIGYLICASLMVSRYLKNPLLQLAGFFLLCTHVYLLDFFSLARGYGLLAFAVLWSVYGIVRYLEVYEARWLVVCLAFLTFGILANFTGLLPWAAIGFAWFIYLLMNGKTRLIFSHGVFWLADACLLFLLLRFPIKTLAGSGEFEWGANNVWETVKDLIVSLLYGSRYLGDQTTIYLFWLFCFFIAGIIFSLFKNKNQEQRHTLMLMTLLLFSNFFIIFLQHTITGSLTPVGRKSVYLIPFIGGFFAVSLSLIRNYKSGVVIGGLISIIMLLHFIRTLPVRSCREWYYDAYYPELIQTVFPLRSKSDSVRLGTTWIFNPSLRYYQQTIPLPVAGLDYIKPLVPDSTMQYYFVESSDTTEMAKNKFYLEKRIGPFYLFKKR
jgi:hypothetical protein